VDQNIQTVSTGFLEFCINFFGPFLDFTFKKAHLHSFGLKAVPFLCILIRQESGEKS
jgi:hypothetical protein